MLFLQPQPEDAPCRGDGDPLIMDNSLNYWVYVSTFYFSPTRYVCEVLLYFTLKLMLQANAANGRVSESCL